VVPDLDFLSGKIVVEIVVEGLLQLHQAEIETGEGVCLRFFHLIDFASLVASQDRPDVGRSERAQGHDVKGNGHVSPFQNQDRKGGDGPNHLVESEQIKLRARRDLGDR
jgi:hypothetical protein